MLAGCRRRALDAGAGEYADAGPGGGDGGGLADTRMMRGRGTEHPLHLSISPHVDLKHHKAAKGWIKPTWQTQAGSLNHRHRGGIEDAWPEHPHGTFAPQTADRRYDTLSG